MVQPNNITRRCSEGRLLYAYQQTNGLRPDGGRNEKSSVADPDPDPPDSHVFGPPGSVSGSISQRYGSGSFYHQAKIVRKTLIPTAL
jgi:hypothetical protein